MRKCSRCGQEKPAEGYTSKTSGYCKDCYRVYRRERYVPVAQRANDLLATDPTWRAKHNAKICTVCKKDGTEVVFRSLARKRCDECEKKSLYRCEEHGVLRTYRCSKCWKAWYKKEKAKKALEREAEFERRKLQIRVFSGTNCGRCGVRIVVNGKTNWAHTCE